MELAKQEKCEFLPFMSPHDVVVNPVTKRISHLVLARNEQNEETGEWFVYFYLDMFTLPEFVYIVGFYDLGLLMMSKL